MGRGLQTVGWALALAGGLLLAACSRQETAWTEASKANTDAAYGAYLEDYPAGAHVAEARQRLGDLREEQEWQRALRFDAPESYQRYLAAYPGGRYGPTARARLADFLRARAAPAAPAGPVAAPEPGATPEPPGGSHDAGTLIAEAQGAGYRVQLGAFAGGEQAARNAWQALRDRHPDLLGQLAPRVDVVTRGGRSLWRLQAGPVSEPRARELCAKLAALGTDCLAVEG